MQYWFIHLHNLLLFSSKSLLYGMMVKTAVRVYSVLLLFHWQKHRQEINFQTTVQAINSLNSFMRQSYLPLTSAAPFHPDTRLTNLCTPCHRLGYWWPCLFTFFNDKRDNSILTTILKVPLRSLLQGIHTFIIFIFNKINYELTVQSWTPPWKYTTVFFYNFVMFRVLQL